MTTDPTELAHAIATQLSETSDDAFEQIERAVQVGGPDLIQDVLKEALDIESKTGLFLPDGRRRTVGGVFFQQLRQRVSPDDWRRIRRPPATHPVVPTTPLKWEDRTEAVDEAQTRKGSVIPPRVRLTGRPRDVKSRDEFVIVTMTDDPQPAVLPRGVPRPPSLSTTYRVCILAEQWRRLDYALRNNPQDTLIVEGYVFPNDKMGTVIVLAKNAMTKLTNRGRFKDRGKF
jgi:hypothetical protein